MKGMKFSTTRNNYFHKGLLSNSNNPRRFNCVVQQLLSSLLFFLIAFLKHSKTIDFSSFVAIKNHSIKTTKTNNNKPVNIEIKEELKLATNKANNKKKIVKKDNGK